MKILLRVLPNGEMRDASEAERSAAMAEGQKLRKLRKAIRRAEGKINKILEGCTHEVVYKGSVGSREVLHCAACPQMFWLPEDQQQQQPLNWD